MLSGSLWVLHIVGALVIADSSDGGGERKGDWEVVCSRLWGDIRVAQQV